MSKRIEPAMAWILDKAHLNEYQIRCRERETQEAKELLQELLQEVINNSSIQMADPSLCEDIGEYLD